MTGKIETKIHADEITKLRECVDRLRNVDNRICSLSLAGLFDIEKQMLAHLDPWALDGRSEDGFFGARVGEREAIEMLQNYCDFENISVHQVEEEGLR